MALTDLGGRVEDVQAGGKVSVLTLTVGWQGTSYDKITGGWRSPP